MTIEKTVIYTVDSQPIHVRETGNPKGQIALFIHGWSSSHYALSSILPLVEERYRCIAVDLPGYGNSPRLKERTTIPAYADLLAKLLQELGDQRPAILIGHSMGGMISLTMANRYPELIERLVLLCPTITGKLSMYINLFVSPITIFERFSVLDWLVSLLEPQFFAITDRIMRPASFAENSGITEQAYHQLRHDARRPGQGRVRAECYSAMRENNLRGKLTDIDIPALVIWGMEDNTVPLRDASIVASEWEDADLRVIPNAGHWPQFETPEVTKRYIRGFISTPVKLLRFEM